MKAVGVLAGLLMAAFFLYGWSLGAAGLWLEFTVLAVATLVSLGVYGWLEERSL